MVQIGSIVNNLIPGEPVVITMIRQFGRSISLEYKEINCQSASSKVIRADQLEKLDVDTEK